MKDARFTIPKPVLLTKVVDLLDQVPMDDRDTKGDLYEYMLGKIASAGQNGQFRTPRHIIQLMVELTQPHPRDLVCDPACGTVTPNFGNTSTTTCSRASILTAPCSGSFSTT